MKFGCGLGCENLRRMSNRRRLGVSLDSSGAQLASAALGAQHGLAWHGSALLGMAWQALTGWPSKRNLLEKSERVNRAAASSPTGCSQRRE